MTIAANSEVVAADLLQEHNADGTHKVLSIQSSYIANLAITAAKIGLATITAAQIASATITGSQIASATILSANIGNSQVATANLQDGAVTSAKIANLAVTATQIDNLTIVAGNIANLTITGGATGKIALTTITKDNIVAGTITADQIAAGTITATQIAAGTITTTQIAAGTITGSNIAATTIAASNIVAGTITTTQIAASTITGGNIAATTITAANITAGTITTTQIAASTITGGNIAGTTITAANIATGTITATQIATGTITATQLSATAIDSMTVTGATIQTAASGARVYMNSTGIYATNGTANQFYVQASDGKAYCSAGNVYLDANGINIAVSTAVDGTRACRFVDGAGALISELGGYLTTGPTATNYVLLVTEAVASKKASMTVAAYAAGTLDATTTIRAANDSYSASLYVGATSSEKYVSTDASFTTTGGLNVGSATGAGTGQVFTSSSVLVNDTANANMTLGLTINQGANNNEIIALKSSDVAHGMTSLAETDTYGTFAKNYGNSGGLLITGYTDADGSTRAALSLQGTLGEATDATKSAAASAIVQILCGVKSGTTVADPAANGNLVAIRLQSGGASKFIFDADGDSFEDGTGWTAYDDYDDTQLLNIVNAAMTRDPIKAEFWDWVRENAQKLQDLKLVYFNRDGHHFINRSKMQELLVGAVRQQGREIRQLKAELVRLSGPKQLEA